MTKYKDHDLITKSNGDIDIKKDGTSIHTIERRSHSSDPGALEQVFGFVMTAGHSAFVDTPSETRAKREARKYVDNLNK